MLDDKNVRRRFRASNYQSTTRVKPFICTMPMRLDDGWNQIQFNLSDFTRRAYGTNYIETLRVQVRKEGKRERESLADSKISYRGYHPSCKTPTYSERKRHIVLQHGRLCTCSCTLSILSLILLCQGRRNRSDWSGKTGPLFFQHLVW